MRMSKVLSAILAVGMVFSMVSCSSNTDSSTNKANDTSTEANNDSNTIRIGVLSPLTGNSAQLGTQVVEIYNMMTDIINEEHPELSMAMAATAGIPSMNNAKIELVVADHKSDTTTAVSEAKRLITEQGVVAICGEFTSAQIKAVAVVTEQYKIPLLGSGSAVTLTDGSNNWDWFIRHGISDATYIKDTFDYMVYLNENYDADIQTVALVSEDGEFGANIYPLEEQMAEEYGFEIVENLKYSSGVTNLTSEVLKIKQADPDVILMASSVVSDALLFFSTCKEQQYTPNYVLGQRGAFIQSDFLEAMGDDVNYMCTSGSWASDINKAPIQELVELWATSEYNTTGVDLMDSHVKDAMLLQFLAMALDQAGTTEPEALREALLNPEYDMDTLLVEWEGIEFDDNGQNILSNGVITQWVDGEYKTVYPAKGASVEPVFPMPEWNY